MQGKSTAALLIPHSTEGECLLFRSGGKSANFQNMLPVYSRKKLTLNIWRLFPNSQAKYFHLISWRGREMFWPCWWQLLPAFSLTWSLSHSLVKKWNFWLYSECTFIGALYPFLWSIICLLLFSLMQFQGNKMLVETYVCLLSPVSESCLCVFWVSLTAVKIVLQVWGLISQTVSWYVFSELLGISSGHILLWELKIGSPTDQFCKFCKSTKT